MASNGQRNSGATFMRSSGKTQSFIIIGLVVSLCIIGYYNWQLSGEARMLETQLEEARIKWKDESNKRNEGEQALNDRDQTLKVCQDGQKSQTDKIVEHERNRDEQASHVKSLTSEMDGVKRDHEQCQSDMIACQATANDVAACNENVQKLDNEKNNLNEQVNQLKQDVENAQGKCAEKPDCTEPARHQTRSMFALAERVLYPNNVAILINEGLRIMGLDQNGNREPLIQAGATFAEKIDAEPKFIQKEPENKE